MGRGTAAVLVMLALGYIPYHVYSRSGLARTLTMVRRLGKPNTVVVNQAPVPREGVEAPLVQRALRGLAYMQADVCPSIIRARTVYQIGLETGRSAEVR